MVRRLLGLLTAVVLVAAVALYVGEGDIDVDLQAVADCTRPLVNDPEPAVDGGEPIAVELVPFLDLAGVSDLARWPDGRLVGTVRTGQVVAVDPDDRSSDETLLDIADRIVLNDEGGILGIAISPDDGHVYLHHTDLEGTSHILRFDLDRRPDGMVGIDDASEVTVLSQEHPGLVHNGGAIAFGPDGNLYIGFGDGSLSVRDALRSAGRDTFAAKLLRITPTPGGPAPYEIPSDNPDAAGRFGRPEILHSGLRNPWRFSIDAEGGVLWIADVGNDCFEEIDAVPLSARGLDLGWPRFEGNHALAADADDGVSNWPILEVPHGPGCAIIGGHVYRGTAIDELDGAYVYADLCEGTIRWVRIHDGDDREEGAVTVGETTAEAAFPVGFWADEDGELYVLTATAGVLRLGPDAGSTTGPATGSGD